MPEQRFLIEYKAARLVMQGGNLEQSELRGLVEANFAFFAKDESRDYECCGFSGALIEEYPGAFLPVDGADLAREGAINAKATAKGLIGNRNAKLAPATVRFAALAARENLTAVLAAPNCSSVLQTSARPRPSHTS